MRVLCRSTTLSLVLGVALAGCGPSSPPGGDSQTSAYKDTQANQVVLRMDGIV